MKRWHKGETLAGRELLGRWRRAADGKWLWRVRCLRCRRASCMTLSALPAKNGGCRFCRAELAVPGEVVGGAQVLSAKKALCLHCYKTFNKTLVRAQPTRSCGCLGKGKSAASNALVQAVHAIFQMRPTRTPLDDLWELENVE